MSDHGAAAYDVLRFVRPLHVQAARAVTSSLQGATLTMGTRALLERLDDRGPQTVPQVAAWLDVTRQAVQRVVDDARSRGFVELRDNPSHRRSHHVALTASGRAAFRRLHADELRTLADVAAGIDVADLRTCAAVLERLTRALAADPAGDGGPGGGGGRPRRSPR